MVTTVCPHHRLDCHHEHPAQTRRRRHLLRAPRPCGDPQRHRHCPGLWRGELTLGYTGDGKRQRRKVSGKTKAAVVDKLRDLRLQLDTGITPKAVYWGAPKLPDSPSIRMDVWKGEVIAPTEEELLSGIQR